MEEHDQCCRWSSWLGAWHTGSIGELVLCVLGGSLGRSTWCSALNILRQNQPSLGLRPVRSKELEAGPWTSGSAADAGAAQPVCQTCCWGRAPCGLASKRCIVPALPGEVTEM